MSETEPTKLMHCMADHRATVEAYLDDILSSRLLPRDRTSSDEVPPPRLTDAMSHAVLAGGKR